MKSLGDDSMPIDVTHDEGMKKSMERATEYPTQVMIITFTTVIKALCYFIKIYLLFTVR